MALQLHRFLSSGKTFSNLNHSPFMPQYSGLQNFPGCSLLCSPLVNAGKCGKGVRLKIRKAGDNCRIAFDQLQVFHSKIEQDSRLFRNLTRAKLRVGTSSTSKTNSIFAFRSFEVDNNSKCSLLPHELITTRFFSVKAFHRVQMPKTLTKGSDNGNVRDRKCRSGSPAFNVLHGSQKQEKSLTVCSSLDGEVQPVVANPSSTKKGTSKSSKLATKTLATAKPKGKMSQNGKSGNSKSAEKDVMSGRSIPDAKNGDATKTALKIAKLSKEHGNKENESTLSGSVGPSASTNSSGSTKGSEGKKPSADTEGLTPQTPDKEIHPVEVVSSPMVNNNAIKHQRLNEKPGQESNNKNVPVGKTEKIATKQKKPGVQGPSNAGSLKASNSKTSKRSLSRGQQTPVEVKVQNRKLKPLYPPNDRSVVVVESLTKAKVIQNYLGDMYEVLPSYGHVRDLAGRSGSVRPDDDFSMVWEVPSSAWTHLKSIKVALNGAKNLILATDPDREGEAIAWHITEMLQQQDALHEGITVARVSFHEITESSIKCALQAPRDINASLVHAYLARRALDYLIGFNISPLLWRKLPGCQSAGRVQSSALALICDREMEIEEFKAQEYWSVGAEFNQMQDKGVSFHSHLTHFATNKLEKLSISSQEEAKAIEQKIISSKFQVVGTKRNKMQRNPPMPYITSTLQQDAANKLHFTAAQTMMLAQKLYEGVKLSDDEATGLITYMRTDGLHVSGEAAKDIKSLIMERYGQDFASKNTPKHIKVKNAQEAHEAIRPTNIRTLPSMLAGVLDKDALKLYTLIWLRAMACQMEPATVDKIQVDIADDGKTVVLRSTASKLGFAGYQAVYKDAEAAAVGHDKSEGNPREEAFDVLHALKFGNQLDLRGVELIQHHTEPSARYSEASLVKKLEELGIGRPSTYASIFKVLQERNYVITKNRTLFPEFRGRMVSAFLSNHFSEVTDYSFTADMENELDNVSAGTTEWKGLLKDYWARFSMYCQRAGKVDIRQVEKMLEDTYWDFLFGSLPNKSRTCPSCQTGTLIFKVSRFGSGYFIGCDQHPKCKYIARTMYGEDDDDADPQKPANAFQPKLLGLNPGSNEKIYLKNGPYGFYIQLGDDRMGFTPKRSSICQIKDVESITLEDAIGFLRYPVTLGKHPVDQHPVTVTVSKSGFSVRHRRTIVRVPKGTNPQDITLDKALIFLQSKFAKRCGRPKGKPRVEEAMEAMFSQ